MRKAVVPTVQITMLEKLTDIAKLYASEKASPFFPSYASVFSVVVFHPFPFLFSRSAPPISSPLTDGLACTY
jgi:hypothetical protein